MRVKRYTGTAVGRITYVTLPRFLTTDGVEVQLRPIVNDYWRVRYSPMSTLLFRSEGDRHITENYAPVIQVNCQQYETHLQCCTLSISSLID